MLRWLTTCSCISAPAQVVCNGVWVQCWCTARGYHHAARPTSGPRPQRTDLEDDAELLDVLAVEYPYDDGRNQGRPGHDRDPDPGRDGDSDDDSDGSSENRSSRGRVGPGASAGRGGPNEYADDVRCGQPARRSTLAELRGLPPAYAAFNDVEVPVDDLARHQRHAVELPHPPCSLLPRGTHPLASAPRAWPCLRPPTLPRGCSGGRARENQHPEP